MQPKHNETMAEHNESAIPDPSGEVGGYTYCSTCEREMSEQDMATDEMCGECYMQHEEWQREQEEDWVQVTRDMAIDAYDRSLEGQWIQW